MLHCLTSEWLLDSTFRQKSDVVDTHPDMHVDIYMDMNGGMHMGGWRCTHRARHVHQGVFGTIPAFLKGKLI